MLKEWIHGVDEKPAVSFAEPASKDKIQALEEDLQEDFDLHLPEELVEYLREANGDDTLMMSVERIFDCNTELRDACRKDHMPLDCLLFFAENGCGGYYGYPIIDGKICENKIYFWWRETDDRTLVAENLKEFLQKYYMGEI